jgi:hypothetical protein
MQIDPSNATTHLTAVVGTLGSPSEVKKLEIWKLEAPDGSKRWTVLPANVAEIMTQFPSSGLPGAKLGNPTGIGGKGGGKGESTSVVFENARIIQTKKQNVYAIVVGDRLFSATKGPGEKWTFLETTSK